MGLGWPRAVWLHVRFTLLLVGVAGLLLAIGYRPTLRLGGATGIQAMWVACGLTVVASTIAALPITFAAVRPRREQLVTVLLGSMLLRMGLVVVLALAVLLVADLERKPLLLWVAISYLGLLPLDTWFALQHPKRFMPAAEER